MKTRSGLFVFGIFFFLLFSQIYASLLLTGNGTRSSKTFATAMKASGFELSKQMYCANTSQESAQNFTICRFDATTHSFVPCAAEKIRMNGQEELCQNPLYDAQISCMCPIDDQNLAVVKKTEAHRLFNVNFSRNPFELFSIESLRDADGAPSDEIVAVCAHDKLICVALNGKDQKTFGTGGSGIALAGYREEILEIDMSKEEVEQATKELAKLKDDENAMQKESAQYLTGKDNKPKRKKLIKEFNQIARSVVIKKDDGTQEISSTIAATPLTIGSDELKIGSDLGAMGNVVDLFWSPTLKVLYVACSVQAGSKSEDGARAIVVGTTDEKGQLQLQPIADASLFVSERNAIVGARGADAQVTIYTVRTMQTTTTLDYLIVQGGVGAQKEDSLLYALPVLNFRNQNGIVPDNKQKLHGTLASMNGQPTCAFDTGRGSIFLGRHFMVPPTEVRDMPTAQDTSTRIGGGALPDGHCIEFVVKDDTVFAVSSGGSAYFSQALFAAHGSIAAWTLWQRIDIPYDISALTIDSEGNFFFMNKDGDTVTHSAWKAEHTAFSNPILNTLQNTFSKEKGGVTALACLQFPLNQKSIMAAANDTSVALMITQQGALLEENAQPLATTTILFDGPELKKMGRLTSLAFHDDGIAGYLFVGGLHGVGVLVDQEGKGWSSTANAIISGLQAGMYFKPLNAYSFVRKIVVDEKNMYVLTDGALDRITIDSAVSYDQWNTTRLASAQALCGDHVIFTDCAVSEKCALLSTSAGLYRVGNEKDVRSHDEHTISWTRVEVPGGFENVLGLYVTSSTGNPQDFARGCAQMYVLTGNISTKQTVISRFAISSLCQQEISDTTIQPVADFIIPGRLNYFTSNGTWVTTFATDGTNYFMATDRTRSEGPMVTYKLGRYRAYLPLGIKEASYICALMREPVHGTWFVAGDFGIRAHE